MANSFFGRHASNQEQGHSAVALRIETGSMRQGRCSVAFGSDAAGQNEDTNFIEIDGTVTTLLKTNRTGSCVSQ